MYICLNVVAAECRINHYQFEKAKTKNTQKILKKYSKSTLKL